MNATTTYADAVRDIAEDIVRQLEDGYAPRRRNTCVSAGGYTIEPTRTFYADVIGGQTLPRGVARITLDTSPINARRPAHEVSVYLDQDGTDHGEAAADIAAAVLDMIDSTADYAR